MNYIKIELQDGLPYVSMEYDSLEAFRDLIFTAISPNGAELFVVTIENDLIRKNKSEELNILRMIKNTIDSQEINFKKDSTDNFVINPGSFK